MESLLRERHAHRLARQGWSQVLQTGDSLPAGVAEFPVREGNHVQTLVDGRDCFAAMLDAIRSARRTVHVAGWHANPDFLLTRAVPGTSLGEALADAVAAGSRVRVLLWGGAPLPVMRPSRADARLVREGFARLPGVSVALDDREYPLHCHHEKLLIVDDDVAFVGGLDLTDLQADRWDTSAHPPRASLGWHDVAVRIRGPVVADVAAHFRSRWTEVTGETLPAAVAGPQVGPHRAQFLRTIPENVYRFRARGEFSILAEYRRALAGAQHFVYLENQFLWAPEIVDLLQEKLRNPPSPEFRLIVLLPRRPSTGRDTTLGQLSRLVEADQEGRMLAATLQSAAGKAPDTYVHAKVGIVDDRWLTIGSANLNAHSLFNDTEANLVLTDPDLVRATRLRLWSEHLGDREVEGSTAEVFDDRWVPVAREQLRRRRSGLPPTHRLCELEGVSARRDLVLGGLIGLLVDG